MTTMSDEAVKKIVKNTIEKYTNANRKALIIVCSDNNTSAVICSNMEEMDAVEAGLTLVYELIGDKAETVFKDAAKQVKQLKKAKVKDAKRKNRA